MADHPIVLVHGLFGRLSDDEIVSAFGGYSVLAPDLIGYGEYKSGAPESWALEDQADHVATWIAERYQGSVHLVGHSVGGAVAMLVAHRHSALVRSVTSVEGNFTLQDAFWSQKIAIRDLAEIEEEVVGFRKDAAAWIRKAGVPVTPVTLGIAVGWLGHQPVSTLRAQARAVVDATGGPGFLETVRGILDSGLPLHLIAGSRSRGGWGVPDWVMRQAASNTDIPATGHLMMLEAPAAFADAVLTNLRRPV